ncbi:MAG: hypothetical protein KC657_40225 [Myxococcales bacterium]|nr:hypothetical protein [Myxococcales bacterium]
MSEAAERRRRRQLAWSSKVFRGPRADDAMELDALEEWAAMAPRERLALAWELSLDQYGGADDGAVEPRLPRSAYRVERR